MVKLEEFLQKHSEYINKNDWGTVYYDLNLEVSDDGETGDFTRFLILKCGINPLDYLHQVPPFYMYVSDDKNPQDIPIKEIIIPEGIRQVESHAFWANKQLKKISLPSTLLTLGPSCFNNCPNVEEINYEGTWKDWLNVNKLDNWYTYGWKCGVSCFDGKFDIFTGKRMI